MPRLHVATPAYGTLLGSGPTYRAAPSAQTLALARLLQQVETPTPQFLDINVATGFAGVSSGFAVTPQAVAQRLRRGTHWVDYGAWPFGNYGFGRSLFINFVRDVAGIPLVYRPTQQGFGAFVHAAGIADRIPPPNPADRELGLPALAACIESWAGLFNGFDPYAFSLCLWSWGGEAASFGYPDSFGFPTALGGPTADFRPMPGTRAAHALGAYGTSVYEAFALRVGPAWYFQAQATVPPAAYAAFITETIGGHVAPAAYPGPYTCANPHKPSLTLGDTGPWVALAQSRLNVWGAHLTVDGVFGPLTQAAVRTLQGRYAGRVVRAGLPAITVSGTIGPGLWALLCQTPPGARRATHPAPAPAGPCKNGLVSTVSRVTGLDCTLSELVLIGGALTLLVTVLG